MKVVGIGLNRTGTKTLGACFRHWGLRHVSYNHDAFEPWGNHRVAKPLEWVAEYDSFEDWPWPLIFREIDREFPGTRFILTRRTNTSVWHRSLCRHAAAAGPTDCRKYIYGHAMPRGHEAEHIAFYEQHLDTVHSHFCGRPADFLELCWEEDDGWKELASRLGLDPPRLPFPHLNQSAADGNAPLK